MSASAAARRSAAARVMRNPKLKERDRWISLWSFVLTTEIEAGTMFVRAVPDGQIFAVLGDTHEIVSLSSRGGDHWHAHFHRMYGYAKCEKVSRFIYDILRAYVISNGERVELRRFAAYNQETQTAYLSTYDGHFYKIQGSADITVETQGVDNVFFADDDGGVGIEPDVGEHGVLLDRLASPNFAATGSSITPEQQRMALIVWMFAVAFPDLMPTKPILLLEGVKGSGKTSAVEFLQLVVQGRRRPISLRKDREDDFGVILLRNPLCLIDNQDSFVDWLPDAICAYATGAQWEKRKLWTDDESVIIKPHAFVAFTTRNPASFRRDDVIDRCVILRFDRRTSFRRMEALERDILDDRARLLGEYLWYVGRIVDVIREGHDAEEDEIYRMADFASFARIVGRVLRWSREAVDGMLRALQAERDAFLIEEDPLIDLINEWLAYQLSARAQQRTASRTTNRGRLINVFQLCSELEILATARALPWKETPRTLPLKLRAPHMEGAFHIELHKLGGHNAFRIWRKDDPRLEVVDGS